MVLFVEIYCHFVKIERPFKKRCQKFFYGHQFHAKQDTLSACACPEIIPTKSTFSICQIPGECIE